VSDKFVADIDRGCAGDVVILGHPPHIVDENQVIETLDSLLLNDDEEDKEDRLSIDSDSDTLDDLATDPQPPLHPSSVPFVLSTAAHKDEKSSIQDVSSPYYSLFGKATQLSSSDRFQRGLLSSCIVDVSNSAANTDEIITDLQQSADQDSLSSCDSENTRKVHNAGGLQKLQKKVAPEQTTLERVKTCLYEWKTEEMVAFIQSSSCQPGVSVCENTKDVSNLEEVNRDSVENNVDERDETLKLYERKVGEFYGQKPRVRFADSCKQVVNLLNSLLMFVVKSVDKQRMYAVVKMYSYSALTNLVIILNFNV